MNVRDRIAWRIMSAGLRIATPKYRKFITGSVEYGLRAAARDEMDGRPSPRDWRTFG